MCIKFIWDETYSVGNTNLDAQHRRIIELANTLSYRSDEEHIKRAILRMFKHLNEHFSDEEKMMKQIGYPKRAEHQELHNGLITKLSDINTQLLGSTGHPVIEFKKFIFELIVDHIMSEDKDYSLFLQKKQFMGSI